MLLKHHTLRTYNHLYIPIMSNSCTPPKRCWTSGLETIPHSSSSFKSGTYLSWNLSVSAWTSGVANDELKPTRNIEPKETVEMLAGSESPPPYLVLRTFWIQAVTRQKGRHLSTHALVLRVVD